MDVLANFITLLLKKKEIFTYRKTGYNTFLIFLFKIYSSPNQIVTGAEHTAYR
jgi:hypothetical protein